MAPLPTLSTGSILTLVLILLPPPALAQDQEAWKKEWRVQDGYALSSDAEGFHLPTAIAFVPNPGPGPKDPLYFVTEVRGTLKVVTNDRSVHVFASDFFDLEVEAELPSTRGEAGMAGLGLDPENGYVFVTFTFQDEHRAIKNNIVRFESEPHTFGLKAKGKADFFHIFEDHSSALSHMIGPVVAHDGALYVGVGDARNAAMSRDDDSPLGKILRMSLDGQPLRDNPLYTDGDPKKARNYIWAKGVRNPFSLAFARGQLFCGDNGPGVDRFIKVEKGRDYLYDGSNWSVGTNSNIVFGPAVSPVQMTFIEGPVPFLSPEHQTSFFVALSGFVQAKPGPGERGEKSVIRIAWDFEKDRVAAAPIQFLQYAGRGRQLPVGLAAGPDGLYVAPLLAGQDGKTRILKIEHKETAPHPYVIGLEPTSLMADKGCFGCHNLDSGREDLGPTLDPSVMIPRIEERLNSAEYLAQLDEIDGLDSEPFQAFRAARDDVRKATGRDRTRVWLKYQLIEPKFDDPSSQMANLGLTEAEATLLADFFLSRESHIGLLQKLRFAMTRLVPRPRQRHLVMFFAGGLGFGVVLTMVGGRALRRVRRKRTGGADLA